MPITPSFLTMGLTMLQKASCSQMLQRLKRLGNPRLLLDMQSMKSNGIATHSNTKTMKQDKNTVILAHFYKSVATLILKSANGRVALSDLEERMPRHKYSIFSWMQWRDAKEWFTTAYGETPGLWYALRSEYKNSTVAEMVKSINQHYHLYQQ